VIKDIIFHKSLDPDGRGAGFFCYTFSLNYSSLLPQELFKMTKIASIMLGLVVSVLVQVALDLSQAQHYSDKVLSLDTDHGANPGTK
jgi:hypothetical protein